MTDEAFIIRVKRIINEVNKRPNLNFFFRIDPLLQEYRNTATKSNRGDIIDFSKAKFDDKDDFITKFNEVIAK